MVPEQAQQVRPDTDYTMQVKPAGQLAHFQHILVVRANDQEVRSWQVLVVDGGSKEVVLKALSNKWKMLDAAHYSTTMSLSPWKPQVHIHPPATIGLV